MSVNETELLESQLRDREQQAREAERDLLTGFYSQSVCREIIKKKLEDTPEKSGAFLLFDIDNFSLINQKFGHLYGDSILESVSSVVYANFKAGDIAGRFGGDVFMLFCPRVTEEKQITELLDKFYVRVHEFVIDKEDKPIGISAGAVLYRGEGYDYETLLRYADFALAKAKKEGKDRYIIYDKSIESDDFSGEIHKKMCKWNQKEIESDKRYPNINKELFDFAFEIISRGKDFYGEVYQIFEEISLSQGLDRSTLIEYNNRINRSEVSVKWKREDDGEDNEILKKAANANWKDIESIHRSKEYLIIQNGRIGFEPFWKDIESISRIPLSAIQFAVMDGANMAATITFESWKEKMWDATEIATLSSITKMISSYLLHQQSKDEMQIENAYAAKAMDVQKLVYYAVEENTYQIKYMSLQAIAEAPHVQYGEICYQVLKNNERPCKECPIASCSKLKSESTVEMYDCDENKWYTMTAARMEGVLANQYLLCKSNVTDFLDRVRGKDQLTGTYSYERFRAEALRLIGVEHKQYILIFLGIQDFSAINDEYGYEVGDQVLKAFANILRKNVMEGELLCRAKGDDFIVLALREDEGQIRQKVKSITEELTAMFRKRYAGISTNCFGGVYETHKNVRHISRCMDNAMKARRVAQENYYETGGVYTYSSECERKERESKELERQLKDSVNKGKFKVFFQPKIDIMTNEIKGAEALVRLVDKDNCLVPPDKFIPLAEKSGLIVEIDKFVYEQTFSYMKKWIEKGLNVPLISVNMSRLHLMHDDLPFKIKALSDKYNLSPAWIELEITESVFFEDTDRLIKMIKKLKELGYVISMDDFGAGFSTLSLMKLLPVDIIKIDGSFFKQSDLDEKNKAVIASIMQLAKNLKFETVSEGVETREQVDFIKSQGGKYIQGFYSYKPMCVEDFEKLLISK